MPQIRLIAILEIEASINDKRFARTIAEQLHDYMQDVGQGPDDNYH